MKKTTKKVFVLDTNVLLTDHQAMFKFDENTVHIPMVVIEELDRFKTKEGDIGFQARQVARYLDKLCKRGELSKGVKLNNNGKLFVKPSPTEWTAETPDNQIIKYANKHKAILISKDINMRLKARALGLEAQDHEPKNIRDVDTGYTGHSVFDLTHSESEELKDRKSLSLNDKKHSLSNNEYVIANGRLCRYSQEMNTLVLVREYNILGIKAKNVEQRYALDALMNPDIKLVTLMGKAGTGKTLLAIAAALEQTLQQKEPPYTKVVVARPNVPMGGRDIGFLPGDINEKLMPWAQPIFDNIDYILEEARPNKGILGGSKQHYSAESLVASGDLRLEALAYMRGRSMPRQFIIIDEAQNLSPHEIKTILTRAGEGTKIVLTGDIQQIDTQNLDYRSNGLTYVVNKFRDQKIAAHITLSKGERSELAELSSELL